MSENDANSILRGILEGIDKYTNQEATIHYLAEAYRLLNGDMHDGDIKGNRHDLENLDDGGYLDGDWSKMVRRILHGWAECHERPTLWPWTDHCFDWMWSND